MGGCRGCTTHYGVEPCDCNDVEDDGYCEWCDEPNPEFELNVPGPIDITYLFCKVDCALSYQAARS